MLVVFFCEWNQLIWETSSNFRCFVEFCASTICFPACQAAARVAEEVASASGMPLGVEVGAGHGVIDGVGEYPPVNKHSHGKNTILMVFTREDGDFHGRVI